MLYRVLRNLSTGHVLGDVVSADRFRPDAIKALLEANAICKIEGPPLRVLEGWTRRAELLEVIGIVSATQFLYADDDVIREAWGHTTTRAVRKAKAIISEMLDARIVRKLSTEK